MAKEDYYYCDLCGNIAFYNGEGPMPAGVSVKALCNCCVQTHEIIIRPISPAQQSQIGSYRE